MVKEDKLSKIEISIFPLAPAFSRRKEIESRPEQIIAAIMVKAITIPALQGPPESILVAPYRVNGKTTANISQ